MIAPPLLSADSPVTEVIDEENPWPGLASFEERYENYFYGREREEKILLRRVLRRRLTVLTGRSGMGKTSLLQAGLFPRLRRLDIFPVYIKLDFKSPGFCAARQIFDAILEQANNADYPVEVSKPLPDESVWEYLHRHDADFWSRENLLLKTLLVFDAFEEVLERRGQAMAPVKEIEAFLSELADLAEGRAPEALFELWKTQSGAADAFDPGLHNYKILLSLREDFLADLDEWTDESLPSGSRNRLRLHPMNGERALDAVLGPGKNLIEPEVGKQIVRWVAGAGVKDRPAEELDEVPLDRLTVEPALLSLVCRELNNKRLKRKEGGERLPMITEDLLEKGKTTIIEDFYLRCMAGVLPSVRTFVEDRLLLADGRRDNIALPAVATEDPQFFSDLRRLQELRLLRIEPRDGVERVELTHDVLTAAVRASRDARRQREAEEEAERKRHARDMDELNRRIEGAERKLKVALFVILCLVVSGLVWTFYQRQRRARAQLEDVRVEKKQAESGRQEANRLLAMSDVRVAASLVEEDRTAEGLAFLARAARVDPDGLTARSAIIDLLMHHNWPLALGSLHPKDRLQASRLDAQGRFLAVSSSGPQAYVWMEADPGRIGSSRELAVLFPVEAADFSSDGRRLVLGAADGHWQAWDLETLAPVAAALQTEAPLHEVIFGPDGKTVLVLFGEGRLGIWDAETGRALWPARHHGNLAKTIFSAEFSRDGRFLVTAADDFTAQVWAVPSGAPVGRPLRHKKLVYSARFSADGLRVVTASADGTAQVWDTRTGRPTGPRLRHRNVVRWAELSPDGRTVATASWDATAQLWDAARGRVLGPPMLHQGRVQSVRFSPDGRFVVTASSDGTARLWDARSGCPTHEALRLGQSLDSALFSPDGRRVLTQSGGAVLRVWDIEPGLAREAVLGSGMQAPKPGPFLLCRSSREPEKRDLSGLIPNSAPPPGIAVRLSRSGNVLAVGMKQEVRLYRVGADRTLSPMAGAFAAGGEIAGVALGPDGSRLAAVSNLPQSPDSSAPPGRARVWEIGTRQLLLDEEGGPFSSVDFSADGLWLAVAWANGRVDLGVLGTDGQERLRESLPPGATARLSAVRFGASAGSLAAAYSDYTARLWDLRSKRPLLIVPHLGRVFSAEVSQDGRLLVTAASNGIAREIRIDTQKTLSDMVHPVSVWSAGFGPEAGKIRRIVTVAADSRVRLWEPRSGQLIGAPLEHPEPAVAAYFLPDGQSLITVAKDGTIRLWDTPTGSPHGSSADVLASLAEAVGGFKVNSQGMAAALADPTGSLKELRSRSTEATTPERFSSLSFLRWFFADRTRRTTSPFLPLTPEDRPASRRSTAGVHR